MHRILERQISRSIGTLPADTPHPWLDLLQAVSNAYAHADDDRRLLTRSIELSSREFSELNERLRLEKETVEQKVRERTAELTKANAALRELDERKSEFLSIAAHQLRTPLSGLKWALNMLIGGEAGPLSNEQKTLLMKSYEANERLISLVGDMLQANKIEKKTLQLNKSRTHILDLLDNVLYEVLPNASKRRVSIRFERRDDTLPPLVVDPEKIRAVFQNLLENAVKYSQEGGEVIISVTREGNGVRCAITDHGIGISAEARPHIFSRFFRADNAKKLDPNGTGLGLYIAKSIIDMHGGRIWFESGKDGGTTFYVTIGA